MEQYAKKDEVKRIEKDLYGKLGLTTSMGVVANKVDSLAKSINSIEANVKVLLQFQTQIETKEEAESERKAEIAERIKEDIINKRWRTGLTITTMISLITIIISLLTINFA
jgi:hypothetical protein